MAKSPDETTVKAGKKKSHLATCWPLTSSSVISMLRFLAASKKAKKKKEKKSLSLHWRGNTRTITKIQLLHDINEGKNVHEGFFAHT